MEARRGMPRGMYLGSAWSASSLAAPGGRLRLDHYVRTTGVAVDRPIPLRDFIDYGIWFLHEASARWRRRTFGRCGQSGWALR